MKTTIEGGLIVTGPGTCAGYIFNFTGHGAYDPTGKKGDFTEEQIDTHNAILAKAEWKSAKERGRATLYLTKHSDGTQHGNFAVGSEPAKPVWTVSQFSGGVKFSAYVQIGRHNMAGKRYDAWFTDDEGKQWHGVTYGDNTQICHCRRLKA